jgi:hypothetical protein
MKGSRAVASIYNNSIQLFTLTPQAIYSEYSLSVNVSNYSREKKNFVKLFGGDELIQAQLKLVSLES